MRPLLLASLATLAGWLPMAHAVQVSCNIQYCGNPSCSSSGALQVRLSALVDGRYAELYAYPSCRRQFDTACQTYGLSNGASIYVCEGTFGGAKYECGYAGRTFDVTQSTAVRDNCANTFPHGGPYDDGSATQFYGVGDV